jgi:DNA-binding transcriptional MocR family regulator
MNPHQIVQLLGPWARRGGPLYERLVHALERAIRTGELPPGQRLPAQRWLAQSLGVSRSTTVAAYALLQERGWVTSKRGSGTQVCVFSPKRSLRLRQKQLDPLAHGPTIDSYLNGQQEAIDFSTGATPWPTGLDAQLCSLPPDEIASFLQTYGYAPQGLPQLRQEIAQYYTAFRAAGAHLAAVPIEASGLDLQRLSELLATREAQCLYLSTFHNPTGNVLTDLQRRQLVKMAQEVNLPLIEDLTLAHCVLEKSLLLPLLSMRKRER